MRNEMPGVAHNVVQAGVVHGDFHLHGPSRPQPRQLPNPVDELINQVRVLAELGRGADDRPALDEPLVKVVVGPRGSGKTAVATHWMRSRDADFVDGTLYANLGAWTDHQVAPREVLGEFLVALGVARADLPGDLEGRAAEFRSRTHGRAVGVLLDDVVSAAQVRALLPGAGRSVVVATGHGAFGTLARGRTTLIDVDPLEDDMAPTLLRRFAGDRVDADPAATARLLALCEGLPVALCLVGGMLAERPDLTVAELLTELADSPLTSVAVGDDPTLAALFDLTWARLSPVAREVYRALGAHPTGDVPVAALRGVLPEAGLAAAIRELGTLRVVDKPVPDRLQVHALIREHAASRGGHVRFVDWYLTGVVTADDALMPRRPWRRRLFPDLCPDPAHPAAGTGARRWLEAERVNLRAAVADAHRRGLHAQTAAFCLVLWSLHEPGKFYDDLLAIAPLGLESARQLADPVVESVLLTQTGFAHLHLGAPDAAADACRRAVAVAAGEPEAEATALEGWGLAELDLGNVEAARDALRRNLALAERIADPRRHALARFHLAKAEPPEVALGLLAEALTTFRDSADARNVAKATLWQGRKTAELGRADEAAVLLREAETLAADWPFDRAQAVEARGVLDPAEYARAHALYVEHGFVRHAAAVGRLL
ncbi:hypothetical protein GCM10022243_19060 [Saccharothrix violaceirubra]